ncbi:heavy metal-binding domain-containing protein [Alkalimonas sp.]|uniref:heavy metal-binding domain-containing protein n=1 Tax=Alkalimonas sp. TaxID=1872453 RepID=UPI00263ACB25|nr:heavy metal-binding domain-containing protein [Alkalimonas sp.]MCC5826002.1 heavy metal-binding domain-containing protein [Alkalimonas sp.]
MLFTTTDSLPGYQIQAVLGVVTGNVVQSKHVGRDIMAGLKGIVGGELKGYTQMMSEARDKAIQRLVEEATQLGADAVVGIRFSTSSILAGSSELLAYGTAVKLQRA